MVEFIMNTIFSVEYLVIGVLVAVFLDISIHYTKSSDRLTFLEIWGCIMCWPIVLLIFVIAVINGQKE